MLLTLPLSHRSSPSRLELFLCLRSGQQRSILVSSNKWSFRVPLPACIVNSMPSHSHSKTLYSITDMASSLSPSFV